MSQIAPSSLQLRKIPLTSRLAGKFLIAFIPLLALFSLGTFFLAPYFYRQHGLNDLVHHAQNMARIAAYSGAPAVYFEDKETLNEVLHSLAQDEDFLFGLIMNDQGQEVALFKKIPELDLTSFLPWQRGLSGNKRVWVETYTLDYQKKQLGQLVLGFSLERIISGTKLVQKIMALVSFIIFTLSVILAYYLSHMVTASLRRITQAASQIASGDYSQRVSVSSRDEVGFLALSFNQMLDRLAETMKNLEEARANLEKRVEERTAELQKEITERIQIEKKLRESEDLFRSMVESLGEGVVMVDENEVFIFANQAAHRIFDSENSRLVGRSLSEFTTPDQFALAQEQTKIRKTGQRSTYELRLRLPGEREKVVLVTATPRFDEHQRFTSSLAVLTDITEMKRTEDILRSMKDQLEQTIQKLEEKNEQANLFIQMSDSLQLAQDEKEVTRIAINYARQFFPEESGALYLKRVGDWPLQKIERWGQFDFKADYFSPDECWALRKGQLHSFEDPEKDILCPHLLNEKIPGPSLCIPLTAFGESLGVLVMTCCREKREEEKKLLEEYRAQRQWLALNFSQRLAAAIFIIRLLESLREQSIRDPLTGLYNRRFLEESLAREIFRVERTGSMIAVMMLDIDHFKQFNDIYGHDAGDVVLQEIAKVLQKSVRREDIVCRYGGEEFAIIMPVTSKETAIKRAEIILERIRHLEIHYKGNLFRKITISIGLAFFPVNGTSGEEVLQAADAALLEAKKAGRDRLIQAAEIQF